MLETEKNKKNTYYIIGKDYSTSGFFALYVWICAQIIYAKQKGYIPVVDLKHHNNVLFKDNQKYRVNAWENFFEQPSGKTLDDIPDDANIIIAGNNIPEIEHLWPALLPLTKQDSNMPKFVDEYIKYLKFNNEIKEYLEENYQKITQNNSNILGILCRGSDYTNSKPKNHAIPPTVEEVVKKAEELFDIYKYEKIWVATEDADVYEQFKTKFKNKLIPNNQYKFKDTKTIINNIKVNSDNFFYNLSRDYLLSMYILSKCKYFIGARTSGTTGVYLLSQKYQNQEYVYLWDKGSYGKECKMKKIVQNVFSIKNEKNHKVITFMGFKIKLKQW